MANEDQRADANEPSEAQKARAQRLRERIARLTSGTPEPEPEEKGEENPRAFVERRMRGDQPAPPEPSKDDTA